MKEIDLVARCSRYEEALREIAKGNEDPTVLALLAYAALYNQPSVETVVETKINELVKANNRLQEAVSLLNSMVLSGEEHSSESVRIVWETMASVDT